MQKYSSKFDEKQWKFIEYLLRNKYEKSVCHVINNCVELQFMWLFCSFLHFFSINLILIDVRLEMTGIKQKYK